MSYHNSQNNYSTSNGEVVAYVTRTNLYTNGGEYTLPNGKNYIGPYHIHPEKGPMVGATHTNKSHDILIPTLNQSPPSVSNIEPNENTFIPEYGEKDLALIPSFNSVSEFRPKIDRVEFSVYNEQGLLETTNLRYKDYSILSGYNTTTGVVSSVEVDPGLDLINEGFSQGFYQIVYNFLRDKAASSPSIPYFIQEISADRTELRLASNTLTNAQIQTAVDSFINELNSSPFFEDFFLNFGNNNLATGIRIALDDETDENQFSVLIKLYEALPPQFTTKDTCWISLQTAEAISFDVEFAPKVSKPAKVKTIKGPNFEIKGKDSIANSTVFQNPSNLLNTVLTSSFNELQYILNQKGAKIDLNYEDFDDFVFFSSAQSRLDNFYIKVKNIEDYNTEISDIIGSSGDNNSISSSISVLNQNITNIIKNFDSYERFLYYTSGSDWTWPKSNTSEPYILHSTSSADVVAWLGNSSSELPSGILGSASVYDENNLDRLVNSLPNFVKDNSTNTPFFLFMDMIGQHFDVFWTYTKALGDRYDADNRLDKGISKDIVADAIRSMGVNLYQNNFSSNDLYASFIGINASGSLLPPTGSEVIESYITASSDITKLDDVNKETYKRIFHNLPFLLKTKGTVTGLRALINTYGIPDTILRISEFGGKDKDNSDDYDYYQSKFNYAVIATGSEGLDGPISSSFQLNSKWNSLDNRPETVLFRFKPSNIFPSGDNQYATIAQIEDVGSVPQLNLTLAYTGSGYVSSSAYSGSIPSASNQYATLALHNGATMVTQVDAPFYDGNWWGVQMSREGSGPTSNFTLRAASQIYNGNDGFTIGFTTSSTSGLTSNARWKGGDNFYLPVSGGYGQAIDGEVYKGFSGSYQELRFYTENLAEEEFHDYVMNPYSVEGLSPASSSKQLAFRAPLGSDLITDTGNLISTHPRITGSYTTNSFASDSDYHIGNNLSFNSNTEFIYYDQPAVGIKNRITEKVRIANAITASGNTLTPYATIQQRYPLSESYTRDINHVEIAFSPQNEINDNINSSFGHFNIGEYIGDPSLTSQSVNSYSELDNIRDTYFEKYYKPYAWHDYVRLIKYFDNSLFKMIKDFIPTKTSVTTGVVIKQHLLERNRQRPAFVTSSQHYYTGSVTRTLEKFFISSSGGITGSTETTSNITQIKGGQGGLFDSINVPTVYSGALSASLPINQISPQITQSWSYTTSGVSGSVVVTQSSQEEFYTGEFSGTEFSSSNGELNPNNPFKEPSPVSNQFYPVDIVGDSTSVKGQRRIAYQGMALGPFQVLKNMSYDESNTENLFGNYYTASIPLSSSYNTWFADGADQNGVNTPSAIFFGKWKNEGAEPFLDVVSIRNIQLRNNPFDTIAITTTGSNVGIFGNFTYNQIKEATNLGCILGDNPSGSEFQDVVANLTTPYIRLSRYEKDKRVEAVDTRDHLYTFLSSSFHPGENAGGPADTQNTIVFHSCSIVYPFRNGTNNSLRTIYGSMGGGEWMNEGSISTPAPRIHIFVDTPNLQFFPRTFPIAENFSQEIDRHEQLRVQYNRIKTALTSSNQDNSGRSILPGYTTPLLDFNDPNINAIYNTETSQSDKGGFLMFNDVSDELQNWVDITYGDIPGNNQRPS